MIYPKFMYTHKEVMSENGDRVRLSVGTARWIDVLFNIVFSTHLEHIPAERTRDCLVGNRLSH